MVALRTILAFVRASLEDGETSGGDDEIATMFKKVFDTEGESSGNGKGKGRQVEIDNDDGVVEQMEGFLSGCGDWGLEGPTDAWEVGRLETEASLAGKGAQTEVVAVSPPLTTRQHVYFCPIIADKYSNSTHRYTRSYWPPSWKPPRLHSHPHLPP